jgi:hypothetical protein
MTPGPPRRPLRLATAGLALLVAAWPGARIAAGDDASGTELLRDLGFSPGEIDRIGSGEVIGRSLQAASSDVALAVAATMRVTPAFYLERLRDIATFKKTPEVLQIGKVGAQPAAADFAPLTLEQDDVKDLRTCRVHDCGVKLDRAGIERLASRGAQIPTASSALREHLAAYVQRYLHTGNAALVEYSDDEKPRKLLDDLKEILDQSDYIQRRSPALFAAVRDYAGTLPAGMDGFVYWSKEKMGPRAVASVTHVVIRRVEAGRAVVATKQIFASHYSNASLGVTFLIDRTIGGEPRTLVVYANRTRLDIFGGLLGGLKRPIVRARAREGAERTMGRLRERTERDFRSAAGR